LVEQKDERIRIRTSGIGRLIPDLPDLWFRHAFGNLR
jgi:hypothetical protein